MKLAGSLAGRVRELVWHSDQHPAESGSAPGCVFLQATLHGSGLIDAVYAHAGAAGGQSVYWHVLETNAPALRLCDKVASRSGHVVHALALRIGPLAALLPQESTFSMYHSSFRSESERWRKPRRR